MENENIATTEEEKVETPVENTEDVSPKVDERTDEEKEPETA